MAVMEGNMSRHLNYKALVTMQDFRRYTGVFKAFDEHMNIVLENCEQVKRVMSKGSSVEKEAKQLLGFVVLRGQNVASITFHGLPEGAASRSYEGSSTRSSDHRSHRSPRRDDPPRHSSSSSRNTSDRHDPPRHGRDSYSSRSSTGESRGNEGYKGSSRSYRESSSSSHEISSSPGITSIKYAPAPPRIGSSQPSMMPPRGTMGLSPEMRMGHGYSMPSVKSTGGIQPSMMQDYKSRSYNP